MKKVSIIIPIYNGEKYIKQCIQSIQNQTYMDLEIICVNDGSMDNTEKILKEQAKTDDRILVISKENEGVSIARNVGIQKATGNYIIFIDIDDWIESDWIEQLVNKMEEMDCDIVRGNFIKENAERQIMQYGDLQDMKNVYIENSSKQMQKLREYVITGKIPAYTVLLLIKTSVIQSKVKFQENIPFMEDTIFYIDLLNHIKNIYLYDIKGYHYYYNSTSATKNPDLYMRNIENIKTVNTILHQKVNVQLYSKMNLRHMKSIKEYIFKLYKYKKIKIREIKNILEDEKIRAMLEEIYENDLKKNKMIEMMKKRYYFIFVIWFPIRKIISRTRDKYLGER